MAKVKIIKTKRRAKATKVVKKKTVRRKSVTKKVSTTLKRKIRVRVVEKRISNFPFFHRAMRGVALLLLIALNSVGLNSIGSTVAYYNDIETSTDNTLIAGALDFVLTNGGFSPIEGSLNLQPGTTTSKTIGMALEPLSNPIKYIASTTNVTGDLPFCQAIDLSAQLASISQYSGKLVDFVSGATTTVTNWQYDFGMPASPGFYNSICTFDFEYNGRQTAPHQEYNPGGYDDTEIASSTLYSWGFRINKVYYDVDSAHGVESPTGDNEWVEIYNQTDVALDINGWQICDNGSCDILASSSPIMISAQGFAVIAASSTTWKYWDIPSTVVKIELGEDIGNGLANGGDRLILKRPDGTVMDEMNWQTDTGVWNPGSTDVDEGHMLGRLPNGYDTNQPSDFQDMAVPVVLLINPNQSGNQVWYWTYFYNILWNATNPNGPDSDISINLYWIKDIDGSQTITEADETLPISTGLSNSGIYQWQLPSGFLGYIWVKIVAVGPENPMLNARMISGKVYDPFPLELWLSDPEGVMESLIEMAAPEITVSLEEEVVEEDAIEAEVVEVSEEVVTTEEVITEEVVGEIAGEIIEEETTGGEAVTEEVPTEVPAEMTETEGVVEEVVETPAEVPAEVVETEVAENETISEPVEAPISEAIIETVAPEAPVSEPIIVPEPVVESQPIPTPEPAPEPAPAPVESAPAPAE